MKYKVGDKVRIQPLEWYQKEIESEDCFNIFDIFWCSREMTISKIEKSKYLMEEDGQEFYWTDEMIEGLVEEEVGLVDNLSSRWVNEFNLPDGYIFKDENGNVINATKIVLEKKKKEYPKTYEECAEIMNCPIAGPSGWLFNFDVNIKDPYYRKIDILMGKFTRLLICRDAYWKIAGDEMGLGKPWEPDWNNISDKYCIYFVSGDAWSKECQTRQCPFAFPTPEMRDAFKENFDKDLEFCKGLL